MLHWRSLSALLVMSLPLTASCTPARSGAETDLVLRDVAIFDSATGEVRPKQSIFIDDGRIAAIRDARPHDAGIETMDGMGRLVSPGLIDTHIHIQHQYNAKRRLVANDRDRLGRVYLTHGITTVAEMGQPPAWIPQMMRWQNEPISSSPNFEVVAGSLGSTHEWDRRPPPHHVLLDSPEAAVAQVEAYAQQGASRIKLYWKLERPEMEAAVGAAERLGLTPYAHVDNGIVSIAEAMDLGVRNFEHFFTMNRSIEDPDDLLVLIRQEFPLPDHRSLDEWTLALSLYHDRIERTPRLKAAFDQLLDRMAQEGVTISTALNIMAANAGQSPVYSGFDPYPVRFAPQVRDDFLSEERAARAFETVMRQVKRAHDKGVRLRIGTDASNGGEAALAELELLARAGIPVGDVLRIATWNGAESLGIGDRAGRIAVGRSADLVLFDQDPFESPTNFRAGLTTIKNGKPYAPAPSPVSGLAAAWQEGGASAATRWVERHDDVVWHPVEISMAVDLALAAGEVAKARYLLALLDTVLHGEARSDYVDEGTLNTRGYAFLAADNPSTAIELFQLNAEIHPESWNAHDSLGEALALNGEREAAIVAYERSLELNPDSQTGKDALEALTGPGHR